MTVQQLIDLLEQVDHKGVQILINTPHDGDAYYIGDTLFSSDSEHLTRPLSYLLVGYKSKDMQEQRL